MLSKEELNIITQDLKELAKKDTKRAIKIERKITEMIKLHPERIRVRKSVKGLVKELYEDIRMRDDLDKTNSQKIDKSFLKEHSRIGRIDKKKAWHNLLYYLKKNLRKINSSELGGELTKIEEKIILPEDYDISQTAKIREDSLYIKDKRLHFIIIEDGKETTKKILLKDKSIIILGKNLVTRLNVENNSIECDMPSTLGLLPIDVIVLTMGNFVFIWKR